MVTIFTGVFLGYLCFFVGVLVGYLWDIVGYLLGIFWLFEYFWYFLVLCGPFWEFWDFCGFWVHLGTFLKMLVLLEYYRLLQASTG